MARPERLGYAPIFYIRYRLPPKMEYLFSKLIDIFNESLYLT